MRVAEQYQLAFALSPVPLLLVDAEGVIRLANREFEDMFEYPPGGLTGLAVEALVPAAARAAHPGLRAGFARHPAKRKMGHGRDLEGITRTGRPVPLQLGLEPVPVEGTVWALVSAIDVSTRRQGEALARATLEAAGTAMIMVAPGGAIVSANRAARELFGYAEEELVGAAVELLVPPELRAPHRGWRDGFLAASTARAMGAGQLIYGRHRDGSQFRLEVALTPVTAADRSLVLATIIDLTERLAKERALAAQRAAEAQAARLATLNDQLDRFAYSASHDLKAPLSTITGMLGLCLDDLARGELDEVAANLTMLLELSQRSARKVEGVLRLARIGHDPAQAAPIDLGGTVDRLWRQVTVNDPAPPRLECDLRLDGPFVCNPQAIEVVLENLLSNAAKYRDAGKPDPCVRVGARQARNWLELSVTDNGIGFPADQSEDVFGMFKKLTTRPGDGLGLAIVRQWAEALGGSIRGEGTPGAGAVFTLRLPMKPETPVP